MIEGMQLENGEYGQRAVATSAWSDEMTDFVLGHGIKELELNEGKGWRGNDVSFLANLPRLEALTIIDLKIPSVSAIHFLPELRALEVTTYCHTEIRFSTFSQLGSAHCSGAPKLLHFLTAQHLKGSLSTAMTARMSIPSQSSSVSSCWRF